jgi:hypothetical protein
MDFWFELTFILMNKKQLVMIAMFLKGKIQIYF